MQVPSDCEAARADAVLREMAIATEVDAWGVAGLSVREKLFLSITADVSQGALRLPLRLHVEAGLAAGLTHDDFRALLRYVAHDVGYHVAWAGMERLAELEREAGIRPRPGVAAPIDARIAATSPMPPAVRAALAEVDPHYAAHVDLQSAMRRGPEGLSVRERALVSVGVDVLYQTLDETLRVHVQRAFAAGADRDHVRDVPRFLAQFGVTKAWGALRRLTQIFDGAPTAAR